MFFDVRSNDSFNFPLGWIQYTVIVRYKNRARSLHTYFNHVEFVCHKERYSSAHWRKVRNGVAPTFWKIYRTIFQNCACSTSYRRFGEVLDRAVLSSSQWRVNSSLVRMPSSVACSEEICVVHSFCGCKAGLSFVIDSVNSVCLSVCLSLSLFFSLCAPAISQSLLSLLSFFPSTLSALPPPPATLTEH